MENGTINMGSLIPNVPVTYETIDGVTYATQDNKANSVIVGHEFDPRTDDGRPLTDHIQDSILWGDIRRKAKTHEGLRSELDRVIAFYRLIETENNKPIFYHPV